MTYFNDRGSLKYYGVVQSMLESLGPLGSIADIGSWDTPVATWGDFDQRYTVDRRERPALSGVRQIVGSWPDCAALLPLCDVVTCLQVLEHLDDAEPFCEALFEAARHAVILSVPWKWKAGQCKWHKQDPIDNRKLRSWTRRKPTKIVIVDRPERLIAFYQSRPDPGTTASP